MRGLHSVDVMSCAGSDAFAVLGHLTWMLGSGVSLKCAQIHEARLAGLVNVLVYKVGDRLDGVKRYLSQWYDKSAMR
jgi:hypothetical protein